MRRFGFELSTAAPSRAATRRAVGRKKLLPTMVSRRIEALTFCSAASRIPSGLWLQIFGFMPSFRSRPHENRHQNRNICISFSVPASTNTRKMVKINPYQTKNTFFSPFPRGALKSLFELEIVYFFLSSADLN